MLRSAVILLVSVGASALYLSSKLGTVTPPVEAAAPIAEPETPMPAQTAPEPIGNGFASSRIERSPDGHFYVDAQVNHASIRFLVDTGASMVVLTGEDARRAGVFVNPGDFTGMAQTANGEVKLAPVTLGRVRIGTLEARNVEAAVNGGPMNVSLLGQSYLKQLRSFSVEGDRLILR